MAEVVRTFDTTLRDEFGQYRARAVGRLADDSMWEGWLEFLPVHGGEPIVGGVESRQPQREHLAYWATGLTPVFLEGALRRARRPVTVRVRTEEIPPSEAPGRQPTTAAGAGASHPAAVLDPLEVGGRSLDVLRQELGALNRPRLLNIIAAYDLNPGQEDLSWLSDHQLAHFIVVAVETRLSTRRR